MQMSIDAGVFRRLGASFEYLGAYMDRTASMDMQRLMGEKILAKALELVPVRTGALKSTGRVVKSQDRKGIEVRFGNTRVRYALVVEFGRIQFAPFPPDAKSTAGRLSGQPRPKPKLYATLWYGTDHR